MSSLFPNATIGRNNGSKLLNTSTPLDGTSPSFPVSLTPSSTHPLLASTPSSSSISHPSSSPENSSNLPYQPRKRTPGGSITSLPPTSPSHPASTSPNPSPTTASSNDPSSAPPPHPSIVPLFSNPVVPTISTSQLDSSVGEGTSPTTTSSSSIVTTRLKLTSLKAEAQKGVGLSNDSLGMKMLETMVQKGGEKSWQETMELVVGKSKMTLLLPFATPSSRGGGGTGSDGGTSGGNGSTGSGAGEVTVEMVKEHLVVCEGGGKKEGGIVVTLGGLVGRIEDDALTFYSFIPTDGPLMASLIDPLTRSKTLSSLNLPIPSPIPTTPISSFGISHPFPSLTPLLYSSTLPFPPPLPPASLAPTLPNRPRATSSVLPGMTVAPSRMGNPFAGLFGSRRPAPAATPPPPPPAPLPSSDEKASSAASSSSGGQQLYPPPTITMGEKGTAVPEEDEAPSADAEEIERPNSRGSLRKVASSAELPREPKEGEEEKNVVVPPVMAGKEDTMVSAWGVDKAIRRGEIEKLIGRAMRSLVEKELEGLPSSVINGVKRFISLPHPPTSHSRSHPPFPKLPSRSNRLSMVPTPTISTIPPPVSYSDPEACSNSYQTFFGLVHDELESSWSRGGGAEEGGDVDAAERDKKERELEAKVVEGVSRVEGVVMRWGYNLLFSPAGTNDSKHDVALSSRIAALCMLDLSLDHLGVVTYKKDGTRDEVVVKGLDEIMRSVGEEFKRLESPSHQTPKSQCDVLVRAHKIVIEGLRLLPPIRLRPENEEWTPPPSSLTTALSPSSSTHSSPHRPKKLLPTTGLLSTTPEEGSNTNEAEEKTPKGMGSKEWEGGKDGVVPSLVLEGGVEEAVELEGILEDTSTVKTPMMEAMEESVMGSARDLSASVAPAEPSTSSETPPTSLPIPPPSSAAMSLVSSGSSITSSVLSNETEPAADSGGGTSGADLLLPIIIYATVKSNPSKLVSHLLYIQRYRASMCFSGESSYALVNVTAVVEFLENVDPGSLGLGDSDKVLSVELPPIDFDLQKDLLPSTTSSSTTAARTAALAAQSRLRGRVSQVGELATSGINNVVDTGLGALRSFIGTSQAAADGLLVQVPTMSSVPGMRPTQTRRASAFSIASITASVAGMGSKERGIKDGGGNGNGNGGGGAGNANEWGAKREMVDVSTASTSSRPGSIYERVEGSGGSSDDEGSSGSGSEDGELRAWKKGGGGGGGADDSRSVRSVSSYRSGKTDSLQVAGSPTSLGERSERMSISERLATVGLSSPSSLPKANPFHALSSPPSSSYSSPIRTSVSGASAAASTHSRRASLLGGTPWVPPPAALLSKTTSPPQSPTPSTLPPLPPSQTSSPAPSLQSPNISNELGRGGGTVAPPNERFLSCKDEGDLKLNEVGELLREYRRLAGVLKQVGVWD